MVTVNAHVDSPLAAVRRAQGLSTRDTARRAKIDPSHLVRIERGEVMPTVPVLYRLAVVLGLVELQRLLEPHVPAHRR
jgi:transcriptional regulator with XRE-family HTH domain